MRELRKSLGEHARIKAHLESLTPREREVLDLMTQGKQNKAIGQDLGVSPRTIEIHRARVMEKMGAQSVAELVRMMLDLQHGRRRRTGDSAPRSARLAARRAHGGRHRISHPPDSARRRRDANAPSS